jgi:shikimate dehydrogenase
MHPAIHITGTTRVFMVLGDPVAQVRAPEVYNHLFGKHGIDAVLVPAKVHPSTVIPFVQQALAVDNIDGLWLTIPHKAPLLPLLDRVDLLGQLAGAVNAVRRNADGSLEGALFDGIGFVKALDHFGISVAGRRVLLVGVGGAGMAIAASLMQRGVATLALFDLAPERATSARERLRAGFKAGLQCVASADPAGFDLVVNCTPLGLKAGDALPFDVSRLDAGAAVVDILMTRQPTPLLQACAARGITAHPGYEMLVQQAPEYLNFMGLPHVARSVQEDPSEVRALLTPC